MLLGSEVQPQPLALGIYEKYEVHYGATGHILPIFPSTGESTIMDAIIWSLWPYRLLASTVFEE